MRKNLKGCVEVIPAGEARVLLDMNQYDAIERAGLIADRAHNRSAHMTARWQFSTCHRARFATGGTDLSGVRHLTFSVFALGAAGGSFSLMLDNSPHGDGKNGYECTLPVSRDGWNSYRIELPFLRAVGEPTGLSAVECVCFDCVAAGQANKLSAKLYLDNLFIWEGEAPPLYATMPELKGAAVFSKTGGFTIVDRKRICNTPDGTVAKPFERDGILWLPMAPVAAGIAHSAVVDNRAYTLSFTYRRKKYIFTAGVASMTVDGEKQALTFSPVEIEGMLFFPSEFVREFFRWRQTFIDPMGLVVLSNRKNIFESRRDEALIWQLIADTTFVRPTGEQILEDLHRNFPNPARGRLFASFDELMQLRKSVKTDLQLTDYTERLKLRYGLKSDAFVASAITADATDAEARTESEAVLAFAMLYRVTGDKQYAERAALSCEALCSRPFPEKLTDAAAVAFGMTVCYDWCRHIWSESRKALIERTLLRGAMRPMLDAYEGKGKMWRAGGSAAAEINCTALAMSLGLASVYPQTVYRLLNAILRNAESCFAAYAPDGGCAESVQAWEKSTRALGLMLAMLKRACGSDYGLGSAPGFAATARFPIYAETANGTWNYHDNAAHKADTSILFCLAGMFGNPLPAWIRRQEILSGKKAIHPFDILFYTPVDDSMTPHLPLDAVWRRAGLAMMRSSWAANANLLALHGGRNAEWRGDLDAGAFLLEMDGVRFFEETGGDTALPLLLRRRAAGQNTVVVDPTPEPEPDQNPDAVVPLCEMRSATDRAYAVVDMTAVSDAILRAKRGVLLMDNRRVAVVQDEMTLTEPVEVVWSAWTRAAVKLNPAGRVAVLEKDGKKLACRLCGIGAPARFETETVEGTDWTHLYVCVTDKEKIRMAVTCRILEAGERATARVYDVVPMSRWSE